MDSGGPEAQAAGRWGWLDLVRDQWVWPRFAALVAVVVLSVAVPLFSDPSTYNDLLQYAALVVMGLACAQWRVLAVAYGIFGAVWFVSLALARQRSSWRWQRVLRLVLILLVRRAVLIEAGLPLLILAAVIIPPFSLRLPLIALVVFVCPLLLDGPQGRRLLNLDGLLGGDEQQGDIPRLWGTAWETHWMRWGMPLPVASVAFLVALVVNWDQRRMVAPLFGVVLVSVGLRLLVLWRLRRFDADEHEQHGRGRHDHRHLRRLRRLMAHPDRDDSPSLRQIVLARVFSFVAQAIMVVTVAGLIWWNEHGYARWTAHDDQRLWERLDRPNAAIQVPGTRPAASLFLIADTQFHELCGDRNAAQTSVIDSFVPVAVRPVQLDLLSGATLAQFARLYGALSRANPDLQWAHLGDFGDVGCGSELERFRGYVNAFGHRGLAALTPGNHDSTFVGNFEWHPDWLTACPTGKRRRLDKKSSDDLLRDLARPEPGEDNPRWQDSEQVKRFFHGGYYSQIRELGRGPDGTQVLGIFADSSDFAGLTLGAAGVEGSISCTQTDWIIREVTAHEKAVAVLFLHHPRDELSVEGRLNVARIASALGGDLLGIVSAHTHHVGHRSHLFGDCDVPELVIGSTTDPPQEAALLDLYPPPVDGSQGTDRWVLRLRTIPALDRSDATDLGRLFPYDSMREGDRERVHVTAGACRAFLHDDHRDAAHDRPFLGKLGRPACTSLLENRDPPLLCCGTDQQTLPACKVPLDGSGLEVRPAATARVAGKNGEAGAAARSEAEAADAMRDALARDRWGSKCLQQQEARTMLSCISATPWSGEPLAPGYSTKLWPQLDQIILAAFGFPDTRPIAERPWSLDASALLCLSWAGSVLQSHKKEGWRYVDAIQYAFDRAATPEPRDLLVESPGRCTPGPARLATINCIPSDLASAVRIPAL